MVKQGIVSEWRRVSSRSESVPGKGGVVWMDEGFGSEVVGLGDEVWRGSVWDSAGTSEFWTFEGSDWSTSIAIGVDSESLIGDFWGDLGVSEMVIVEVSKYWKREKW